MVRIAILLITALVAGACGIMPSPSPGPPQAASPTPAPSASGEPTPADPIAALAADLQAAWATVGDLGAFNPEPLYLGSDPAVEALVGQILGQPYASGRGRDPGPDRHAC